MLHAYFSLDKNSIPVESKKMNIFLIEDSVWFICWLAIDQSSRVIVRSVFVSAVPVFEHWNRPPYFIEYSHANNDNDESVELKNMERLPVNE